MRSAVRFGRLLGYPALLLVVVGALKAERAGGEDQTTARLRRPRF